MGVENKDSFEHASAVCTARVRASLHRMRRQRTERFRRAPSFAASSPDGDERKPCPFHCRSRPLIAALQLCSGFSWPSRRISAQPSQAGSTRSRRLQHDVRARRAGRQCGCASFGDCGLWPGVRPGTPHAQRELRPGVTCSQRLVLHIYWPDDGDVRLRRQWRPRHYFVGAFGALATEDNTPQRRNSARLPSSR